MFKKTNFHKVIGIKIPLLAAIPILGISIFLVDYLRIFGTKPESIPSNLKTEVTNDALPVKNETHRHSLANGQLVYPILFNDQTEESANFVGVKSAVNSVCSLYTSQAVLKDAAVYFFDFSSLGWFGINTDQRFTPGSLMKIATAIAVMKRAEQNPNLLNQRILFTEADNLHVAQTLTDETLQAGKSYTAKELLERMLRHSDNHATFLLNKACGIDALRKTYSDFGITMPRDANYQITIRQYVRFFKALFFATYLSQNDSEYVLSLLAQSSFKNGLENGSKQTSNIVIAHKFGERDYNGTFELHDVGIAYKNGSAFLIGVMAKGTNRADLEQFIGQVSATVTAAL
jgi:beta-lactamase class A